MIKKKRPGSGKENILKRIFNNSNLISSDILRVLIYN